MRSIVEENECLREEKENQDKERGKRRNLRRDKAKAHDNRGELVKKNWWFLLLQLCLSKGKEVSMGFKFRHRRWCDKIPRRAKQYPERGTRDSKREDEKKLENEVKRTSTTKHTYCTVEFCRQIKL